MKKAVNFVLIVSLFFSLMLPNIAEASSKNVTVNLPTFDVTLNNVKISNDYRKYPFIVYKGITYFPMTYYDSRFLGVGTLWSQNGGLEIHNGNTLNYTEEEKVSKKNANKYTATIATFPIKVNGKEINNATEPYPLLLFRDVTYFPLTWRFAVDEFNWEYSFSTKEGLNIKSLLSIPVERPITTANEITVQYNTEIIKIKVIYNRFPTMRNLVVSINGNEYEPIGTMGYYYGYTGYSNESGISMTSNQTLDFVDGWIITNVYQEGTTSSHLMKIHYKTGEMIVKD